MLSTLYIYISYFKNGFYLLLFAQTFCIFHDMAETSVKNGVGEILMAGFPCQDIVIPVEQGIQICFGESNCYCLQKDHGAVAHHHQRRDVIFTIISAMITLK